MYADIANLMLTSILERQQRGDYRVSNVVLSLQTQVLYQCWFNVTLFRH